MPMTNLLKLTFGYKQLAKEKIHDNYAWHKKAWKKRIEDKDWQGDYLDQFPIYILNI